MEPSERMIWSEGKRRSGIQQPTSMITMKVIYCNLISRLLSIEGRASYRSIVEISSLRSPIQADGDDGPNNPTHLKDGPKHREGSPFHVFRRVAHRHGTLSRPQHGCRETLKTAGHHDPGSSSVSNVSSCEVSRGQTSIAKASKHQTSFDPYSVVDGAAKKSQRGKGFKDQFVSTPTMPYPVFRTH